MQTNAKQLPNRLNAIGKGQYHINYAVSQGLDEQGNVDFNYTTAHINGEPTYDLLVKSIIADKYTIDDEIALINNYNANQNVQEYEDYQRFRELAKYISATDKLLTVQQVDDYNSSIVVELR